MMMVDSQNKAEELASNILSSSSSLAAISSACTAIEAFLLKPSLDQTRSFFTIAFPCLVYKIFGFDDFSSSSSSSSVAGWIDHIQASNDSQLADRLFNLLSPSGIIFSSISSLDRHSLVKYVFPFERLPEWVKFFLQQNNNDSTLLSDLCPLFKSRIKHDNAKASFQLHLNVFEYYIFWFAYYPLCKGNTRNSDNLQLRKSTRRFKLDNWTYSFPVLPSPSPSPSSSHKTHPHLYITLLYAYLQAYVPNYTSQAPQPYRTSLLHYSSAYDASFLLQTEFLVYTLIHFWLVDNDFSPLPLSLCRSFGVSFPFRPLLAQMPPTTGLGELVTLFVNYLNSSLLSINHPSMSLDPTGSPHPSISASLDFVKSPFSQFSNATSLASRNSLIQRPLYRFILRTFLFCPVGTSVKNVSHVFSLWISYMEPWKICNEDFVEFDAPTDKKPRDEKANSPVEKGAKKDTCQSASGYTSSWEGYVLSNYLFYTCLTMRFLRFAHKFLHTDVETIIQMVLKVLNILTSSEELMDLLKKVDTAFHSKVLGSSLIMFDSSSKFVPSIPKQVQEEWEDGLCDGDLRLMSDGGHELLEVLIVRAECEIQMLSCGKVENVEYLKVEVSRLFDGKVERKRSVEEEQQQRSRRNEIFKPRWVGNERDWMKRAVRLNGRVEVKEEAESSKMVASKKIVLVMVLCVALSVILQLMHDKM